MPAICLWKRANSYDAGQQASTTTTFTIKPLAIPPLAEPMLDGACDDAVYSNAPYVPLKPEFGSNQAYARLLHTDTDLWICFSGLRQGGTDGSPIVAVQIDPDYSRDVFAQQNDYQIEIFQNGSVYFEIGAPANEWWQGVTHPEGFAGLAHYEPNGSQAEIRIPESVVGGWGHRIGLGLAHRAGQYDYWPPSLNLARPTTWAEVMLAERYDVYLPLVRTGP